MVSFQRVAILHQLSGIWSMLLSSSPSLHNRSPFQYSPGSKFVLYLYVLLWRISQRVHIPLGFTLNPGITVNCFFPLKEFKIFFIVVVQPLQVIRKMAWRFEISHINNGTTWYDVCVICCAENYGNDIQWHTAIKFLCDIITAVTILKWQIKLVAFFYRIETVWQRAWHVPTFAIYINVDVLRQFLCVFDSLTWCLTVADRPRD